MTFVAGGEGLAMGGWTDGRTNGQISPERGSRGFHPFLYRSGWKPIPLQWA